MLILPSVLLLWYIFGDDMKAKKREEMLQTSDSSFPVGRIDELRRAKPGLGWTPLPGMPVFTGFRVNRFQGQAGIRQILYDPF